MPDFFHSWYYGVRYNAKREQYGIPIIPPNWECNKTSGNYYFWYPPNKEKSPVYIGKEVKITSFSIYSEKDTYRHNNKDNRQILSITRYYDFNLSPLIEYREYASDDSLIINKNLDSKEANELVVKWEGENVK